MTRPRLLTKISETKKKEKERPRINSLRAKVDPTHISDDALIDLLGGELFQAAPPIFKALARQTLDLKLTVDSNKETLQAVEDNLANLTPEQAVKVKISAARLVSIASTEYGEAIKRLITVALSMGLIPGIVEKRKEEEAARIGRVGLTHSNLATASSEASSRSQAYSSFDDMVN